MTLNMRLCLWLGMLLLLLAVVQPIDAANPKSRHPSLDPLSSSDSALSRSSRQKHSAHFLGRLQSYAQQLEQQADTMLLQAAELAVHRSAHAAHALVHGGVDPTPDWIQSILARGVNEVSKGEGTLHTKLTNAAAAYSMSHPPTDVNVNTLAAKIVSGANANSNEIEARIQFNAKKAVWDDVMKQQRAMCLKKLERKEKCDGDAMAAAAAAALATIADGKVPAKLKEVPGAALAASPQLDIVRKATTPPETSRDLEASIAGGIDPWYSLPGRSKKALDVKEKTVADLLDGDAERCPSQCSKHGQCLMDMDSMVKSPSGSANVHPFHCICDKGYVGNACQIKLDMHLRWLLTEGVAPFPKCCSVCQAQREVPLKWDDIPTYNNPFASFAPKCQPFPRVSMYSREDGSHEMVRGRRPDPSCSAPLGEITHADPIVALELATALSSSQRILSSGLLEDMAFLELDVQNQVDLSAEEAMNHMDRLSAAAHQLKATSAVAQKAAKALAAKLRIADMSVAYSSIDLKGLLEDAREMPNQMEECCLFCQLDEEAPPLAANRDPSSNTGPNAILNKDPRLDNSIDALHRRMALKRQEKREAQQTGTMPKSEQECCLVCPYNFRELERLEEAAFLRSTSKSEAAETRAELAKVFLETESTATATDDEQHDEAHQAFLETFASVDASRRRRHEPRPCCAACPSQFLIAHAFPANPWTKTRTLPNQGPV